MRIASLMQSSTLDFENRKKALQRKEMGEAYKRTAQFAKASQNPMLAALENLLSGKTEKDLLEADTKTKSAQLETPEAKAHLRQLQMTEDEVKAHEQAHKAAGSSVTGSVSYTYTKGPDKQLYVSGGEVSIQAPVSGSDEETIKILEQVRKAALAPAQPSPQDLRVAASATAQIQQVQMERGEEMEPQEEPPFVNEDLTFDVPERFRNDGERDATAPTIFGKELENLITQRAFNKAKMQYQSHIEMVRNGYGIAAEPVFSKIA
ncbi:putative metalloprotease CJM1_0395 family protein [Metasolibacillus meyeri]|uniref:Metalloprotease CJM1_0395 family protein n=1 Tax=Metasolibacillus meyeri TaxID=1071052 RepID=A0AAW9NMK8_9BACL|nr:putative metalloprotease CJM1_0395 family protein [Metasolibacillus meyeri]MEC1178687.1 putative metalloprotease CJM1_0395 family protein [Metasolibacillus meyeri]